MGSTRDNVRPGVLRIARHLRAQLGSNPLAVASEYIPRPLDRRERADGAPMQYRTRRRNNVWRAGQVPEIHATVVEGDSRVSI